MDAKSSSQAFQGDYQQCKKRNSPKTTVRHLDVLQCLPGCTTSCDVAPIGHSRNECRVSIYDGGNDVSPLRFSSTKPPQRRQLPKQAVECADNALLQERHIKVILNANDTKDVVADGVRIVPVATVLSLNKSFNSEEVTVRVKIQRARDIAMQHRREVLRSWKLRSSAG